MQWFRMYAEYATDPKVQSMSETFQRRFTMFLCLQCNGEYERLSADELACALRITPEELASTREVFQAKGFLDGDGKIRNWNKRQYKSDDVTSRVRKHREDKAKQACNVSVTPSETDSDTESEKEGSTKTSPQRGAGEMPRAKRSADERGSRLPTPFTVSSEMRKWAAESAQHVELNSATQEFCDYWRAIPGKQGRKLDWVMTWRNRMRECEAKAMRSNGHAKPKEGIGDTLARLRREADEAGEPAL